MSQNNFRRRYRLYEILGVATDASQEEIEKAYEALARKYHPGVKTDSHLSERLIRIEEAYKVLSHPPSREVYDSSPAECPLCCNHEVGQFGDATLRCFRCGWEFDPSRQQETGQENEPGPFPAASRLVLREFQSTQCSWCSLFFTRPFLCPHKRLRSSCLSFKQLDQQKRLDFMGDPQWWWQMVDMTRTVEQDSLAKCRECLALNPNPPPLKDTCWRCGENSLRCPKCDSLLSYIMEDNLWRCINSYCSRKFTLVQFQPDATTGPLVCPKCASGLQYDSRSVFWKCMNAGCRRTYSLHDLKTSVLRIKAKREAAQVFAHEPPSPIAAEPLKGPPAKGPPKSAERNDRNGRAFHPFLLNIAKIGLCLAVITLFALLPIAGYSLFSHKMRPVPGTIVFLLEAGFFIGVIVALRSRRFRYRRPSFKLVFWPLLAILVVSAFGGIEPFASWKDDATKFIEKLWPNSSTQTGTTRFTAAPATTPLPTQGPMTSTLQTTSSSATAPAVTPRPTQSPTASSPQTPSPSTTGPGATSPLAKGQTASTPEDIEKLKLDMLVLINNDRKQAGLAPVTLGTNAAAQKHADDMLANFYLSHWDTGGLKPYMRYTLEGGSNMEAENSAYSGWYDRSENASRYAVLDAGRELRALQHAMMYDDADSDWGHRDTILGRWYKRVNIGIAYDRHRLALVQQFEGDYVVFDRLPSLSGGVLTLTGRTSSGKVDSIALYWDPLPQGLTQSQLNGGPRSYSLGKEAGYILPADYEMTSIPYVNASTWLMDSNGLFRFEADISPLLRLGKGVYTVVIWGDLGGEAAPLTNYSLFMR